MVNKMVNMTTKNYLISYLTVSSFFLWTISIFKSNIDMAEFGLIQSLPFLYFISLGILLVAFLLSVKWQMNKIKFLIILLLIMYIFLTPTLIEGTPRFRSSYKVYGFVDYINRNGHIDPQILWYHNWPGAFMSMSILSDIIDPNHNSLFWMYFPFIIQIMYFFPMYILLKSLFQDEKKIWLGIWIFYILDFINQDYMSPQAIAYLFYLIILSIIVKTVNSNSIINNNSFILNNNSFKVISILIFSSLVITHMITSMLVIFIFFFLALFSIISKKNSIIPPIYKFTFLGIMIFVSWTIYGAFTYFKSHLLEFFEKSYKIDLIFSQNLEQRISGSPAHLIISKLMILSALIAIGMAITGIIISYYRKDKISFANKNMLVIVFAILIIESGSSYGGEMIMRVFLFFLPLLSFFIPQIFVNFKMKTVLILFLVIMTPMNILIHYGNEKYDYVSKGELVSYDLFYKKIENRYIIGGYPLFVYKFPEKYTAYQDWDWDGKKFTPKIGSFKDYNVMISRGDIEGFEIFYNNRTYINSILKDNLMDSNNYFDIYSNGDSNIFNYRKL